MFWGASLIIIGVMILLDRLGIVDLSFSEYFVPMILIAFGVSMIGKRLRH